MMPGSLRWAERTFRQDTRSSQSRRDRSLILKFVRGCEIVRIISNLFNIVNLRRFSMKIVTAIGRHIHLKRCNGLVYYCCSR